MDHEWQSFPVRTEIKVEWGDMDAAQHVNNLIYLRWFETVRVDYFIRLGTDVVNNDEGPGFILAKQDCKYLFPLTYPDTVIIATRVVEIKHDRFTMHCHIFSRRHQRLAAIANGVIVTFDYAKQQKAPIPEDLLHRIAQMEGLPLNQLIPQPLTSDEDIAIDE